MGHFSKALCCCAIFAMMGFAPLAADSKPKTVMVLFDGVTEVNREAVNFIYRAFVQSGSGLDLTYTQNPSDIKPGVYKAIIVLSTGYRSGVDPRLEPFVKAYSAKPEIILVQLFAGSSDWSVGKIAAAQNPLGVDALTAASAWGRRGFSASPGGAYADPRQMHAAWVQDILTRLARE